MQQITPITAAIVLAKTAGIIIAPGLLDPQAALIEITVDGTSCMQAAFKTKKETYHLKQFLFLYLTYPFLA